MSRQARAPGSIPSAAALVWRFAAAALVSLAAVVLFSVFLAGSVGTDVALDEARRITRLTGVGIVQPAIEPGLLTGDRGALEHLNELVDSAVLDGALVRVKVWRPGPGGSEGTILYSDESRLIGETYDFDDDKVAAMALGEVVAESTDLSAPENRFEAAETDLLEVYLPIDGPGGERLLYEAYFDQTRVEEAGRRVWFAFAPLVVGALLVLQLVQLPLAASLATRLRASALARQDLLESNLQASALERRRIAADLHDGVVQDLAGLSMQLTAASASDDVDRLRKCAADAGDGLRATGGALRTLLVDIYPPDLESQGLAASLEDLLAKHRAADVTVDVEVEVQPDLPRHTAELVYRIAQEGLRNVHKHAGASAITLRLVSRDGRLRMTLEDDGRGFEPSDDVVAEDHFGMRLLADSARELGGTLRLSSAPGAGTKLELEVPR